MRKPFGINALWAACRAVLGYFWGRSPGSRLTGTAGGGAAANLLNPPIALPGEYTTVVVAPDYGAKPTAPQPEMNAPLRMEDVEATVKRIRVDRWPAKVTFQVWTEAYMRPVVRTNVYVKARDYPHGDTVLHTDILVNPRWGSRELLGVILDALKAGVAHEMRECFEVDGALLDDPHAGGLGEGVCTNCGRMRPFSPEAALGAWCADCTRGEPARVRVVAP